MTTCIIEHFSSLKDHRLERHKLHSLIDIIVLAICSISSGSDGWEAIEDFGILVKKKRIGCVNISL